MGKGKLFVFSGASGVGKSTVLAEVMKRRSDLRFSVSATTRKPRPGEQEAVNYYFVSREQFEAMIQNGEFLEYDEHMENYYGTPISQLEDKLEKGSVILDIEPVGALNVKKTREDAILIFIAPPSVEELERRLRGRGDTAEDQILIRLERMRWEVAQKEHYDYVVVNDQVETCVNQILDIIQMKLEEK